MSYTAVTYVIKYPRKIKLNMFFRNLKGQHLEKSDITKGQRKMEKVLGDFRNNSVWFFNYFNNCRNR